MPGGALYYTMYGIVNSNSKMLYRNGIDTVIMTVGIATGIVVGTVTINYLIKFEKKAKKRTTFGTPVSRSFLFCQFKIC